MEWYEVYIRDAGYPNIASLEDYHNVASENFESYFLNMLEADSFTVSGKEIMLPRKYHKRKPSQEHCDMLRYLIHSLDYELVAQL